MPMLGIARLLQFTFHNCGLALWRMQVSTSFFCFGVISVLGSQIISVRSTTISSSPKIELQQIRLPMLGLSSWLNNKIVEPLLQILRRGAEPKLLAFSSALGFTLGIFPICGVTFFLCGLAIPLLGKHCHPASVLLANFVATPIELSLIVPFLRLGEAISGGPQFPLTSDALKKVLTGQASTELLLSIAHALVGWLFAAPFILALLYVILLPCFKILVKKYNPVSPSPKKP